MDAHMTLYIQYKVIRNLKLLKNQECIKLFSSQT